MIAFLKDFYFPSQLLTDNDFNTMCVGGKVLEQDERGVKVMQLSDGNILKIFRVRHLVSGARIYSYARRFCRNAKRLKSRDIPTVTIKQLYHFEQDSNTAVVYEPLLGSTLREILGNNGVITEEFVEKFAKFLAKLHHKGIHFHSLHTGNVVQTSVGDFGLIDVSDLSIFPWPLFCNTRVRSFKRLCKYPEDIKRFGAENWAIFLDRYFSEVKLSLGSEKKIRTVSKQIKFES